jgi:hypothetical protein
MGFDTDELKATMALSMEFASTSEGHSRGHNRPVGDAGRV